MGFEGWGVLPDSAQPGAHRWVPMLMASGCQQLHSSLGGRARIRGGAPLAGAAGQGRDLAPQTFVFSLF